MMVRASGACRNAASLTGDPRASGHVFGFVRSKSFGRAHLHGQNHVVDSLHLAYAVIVDHYLDWALMAVRGGQILSL